MRHHCSIGRPSKTCSRRWNKAAFTASFDARAKLRFIAAGCFCNETDSRRRRHIEPNSTRLDGKPAAHRPGIGCGACSRHRPAVPTRTLHHRIRLRRCIPCPERPRDVTRGIAGVVAAHTRADYLLRPSLGAEKGSLQCLLPGRRRDGARVRGQASAGGRRHSLRATLVQGLAQRQENDTSLLGARAQDGGSRFRRRRAAHWLRDLRRRLGRGAARSRPSPAKRRLHSEPEREPLCFWQTCSAPTIGRGRITRIWGQLPLRQSTGKRSRSHHLRRGHFHRSRRQNSGRKSALLVRRSAADRRGRGCGRNPCSASVGVELPTAIRCGRSRELRSVRVRSCRDFGDPEHRVCRNLGVVAPIEVRGIHTRAMPWVVRLHAQEPFSRFRSLVERWR